jgi:hypothetical protein
VGPGTADVEILGYDLGVGVSEPDTVVDVAAELRLRLRPPTARIQLLLSSRASLLGTEAMVGGACMPLEAGRQAGDSLVIFLPESLRAADSLHLQLRYSLPRQPLPAVTYLSRGHRWYPQLIDQIAPFRLRVDLPGDWTSFSGGDLVADSKVGTERQMVWASDMPVFKIELALAPPATVRDDSVEAGGVTFHFVSSRADTAAARQILGDATKAFSYSGACSASSRTGASPSSRPRSGRARTSARGSSCPASQRSMRSSPVTGTSCGSPWPASGWGRGSSLSS